MRTTSPHGDSPHDDFQPSEQLVAYLDGELSAEESVQVERQLATDPALRQQLQELERSWAVLDALPAVAVDASFSQTTMELALAEGDQVRPRPERESATLDQLPREQQGRRWGTVLMLVAAVLCGAVCGRWLWPHPNQQLLANLPVIQYVNVYRQFEDPLFLQLLQQELGPPPWYDPAESIRLEASARQFARLQDVAQRAAWLDQRQPAELTALRAKFNQFQGLAVDERARLQHLHQQITSPQNAAVVPTMLQFQHWLRGLPPVEQEDLRRLPSAAARAERVVQLVGQQRRQRAWALSDEQLRELARSLLALPVVREQLAEMPAAARGDYVQEFRRAGPEARLAKIRQLLDHRGAWKLSEVLALPPAAREQYERLPPRAREAQLMAWLLQARWAMRPPHERGPPTDQQLEEFFAAELTETEQEWLLALPGEEMRVQLEQMYRGVPVRLSQPRSEWDGLPPPRRRGPPPPGRRRTWPESPGSR